MNKQVTIEPVSLHMAMAMAFSEIEAATKSVTGQVGQQKYKYADLGSVIEAIKPALIKHSLFFMQLTHDASGGVCVETVIHHSNGDSISGGKLFVPANKNDAQGFGSALTYARRYSLMTAFGVPAEDDDGNAAAKSAPARAEPVAAKMASDEQRDIIAALAPGAGKTLQGICEAYKIPSLKALTEAQAAKLIERLKSSAQTKEPANV